MFFSQTTQGFYPADWRERYLAAGTWPDDAVQVTPEEEAVLRAAVQEGSSISYSSQTWEILPAAPRPFAEITAPRMASFRQNREIALNRLSGLGFAALLAGDAEHAQEAATVRTNLLDLPELPAVRNAEDMPALEAALDAAWAAAYAGTVMPEIATAMAVGAGGGQTRPPT